MIGLFGSIMFPPFLLLWQCHWCIPGWWLFITLAQRCELCRTKLCITYFSMLLKPPCNLLLIDRRMMNLLFLLWFHFLVSMLVMREFIFSRMVRTVWYILGTWWIQISYNNCLASPRLMSFLLRYLLSYPFEICRVMLG